MMNNHREAFLNLYKDLADMYTRGILPSEQVLNMHWHDLERFELSQIKQAISALRKTWHYPRFPFPADILDYIPEKNNREYNGRDRNERLTTEKIKKDKDQFKRIYNMLDRKIKIDLKNIAKKSK